MKAEIKAVDEYLRNFENETTAYKNSLLYTKSCIPTALSEEEGLVSVYKSFILEERKPEQHGDQPPPQSAMEAYR